MASSDRRESTGVDRRASMRTSMRLSRQPDDDDEYALAAMGISDGFRPADMAAGPQQHAPQSISSNVELPPARRSSPPPRPSSISKPKMDSFALRHDGQMGPVTQRDMEPMMTGASSSSQVPSRMSTTSSINPYVRPESPYRGPSGPSHNYGMYSQESRAQRTASISTTATVPVVERNYTGPSGPTHPYGMYPQNTVPEVEHPSPIAQIPVGFPGLNNNTQFQRRIGPEGEEAGGIIGPDGHQEELPPYTQYPDEAFARKTRPTIVAPALVPGAGGMGVATRNPEFDSREGSLNTPQSRQSTRSFASDGSVHQVNTAAIGASEKPELKHWQIVARRKLCGIVPIWVLVLVFAMFALFGIILGSVFAALKPKNQHKQSSHPNGQAQSQATTTTMTTTFDATPFTTIPSGLPTLPTGTFALPIQIPITVQSSCIDNSAQSAAWACNIAQGSQLQMNVQSIPGTNPTQANEVTIDLGNNSMNIFPYGAQPPIVTTSQVLSLVTDSQDTNKGPAWFFQLPYNKLVVLPEGALSVSNTKREAATFNQIGDFMRRGVAQPGDRPWFCYWNGTLLEAFIYVNLTSSEASQSQTTTSSAASTASRTGSSSAASSTSSSFDDDDPTFLAPYPKVIKIEDRRVPEGGQTISPYCIQQVIDQYGSPSPALNSTGQQIRLFLNETEPTTVNPISDKRDLFAALEPRDAHPLSERASDTNCGCVWMYS